MTRARQGAVAAALAVAGGGALCALVLGGGDAGPAGPARAAGSAERVAIAPRPGVASAPATAAGATDAALAVPTCIDLAPGDVRELTFTYEGRLSIGAEGQGEAEALGTRAAGRLTVTCYRADARELLLGERWAPDVLTLEGQEGVSREALLRDAAIEVLVRRDRQGRVLGLALPARASSEARSLVRALVASACAVLPATPVARWTAPGFDPIGACADTYTCDAADASGARVRRARAITAASGPGGAALDAAHEGVVELTLARDGLPSRVAGREVVRVRSSDAGLAMTLTSTTALERTGARALAGSEVAAALAAVEAGLGAWSWTVGLGAETGEPAHVAKAEPRELETLLAALGRAIPEDGGEVEADAPRLFLELGERLRRDPGAVDRALELARGLKLAAGVRATLIDALGQADTEAAQRALIALAADASVGDEVVPNVFLSLADADRPLPESVAALETAAASDDPLRAEWARQGIGLLANKADPALADRLVGGLEERLGRDADTDRVLLEALGNAGRPRSAGAIAGYTRSEDEELRATAVGALRHMQTRDADAALARALQDESPIVRREALRALAARGPGAALGPVSVSLESDADAYVRLGALEVVLRWLEETPAEQASTAGALRAVVERAAASNGSAEVREAATVGLGA